MKLKEKLALSAIEDSRSQNYRRRPVPLELMQVLGASEHSDWDMFLAGFEAAREMAADAAAFRAVWRGDPEVKIADEPTAQLARELKQLGEGEA